MRLLYLRVFKGEHDLPLAFFDQDLNFDGRYKFYWDQEAETVRHEKNQTYFQDLYDKNISITALVGVNGAGKSSLLRFIRYVIAEVLNDGRSGGDHRYNFLKWVVVYQDGTTIKIRKPERIEEGESGADGDDIIFSVTTDEIKEEIYDGLSFDSNEKFEKSSSVFYSPHFEYSEITHDRLPYVDISTDFLFYEAMKNREDVEQSIQVQVSFYREEVNRQIAFIRYADKNYELKETFFSKFLPESVDITFQQNEKKFKQDPRYISFEDIEIYKEFDRAYLQRQHRYKRDFNAREIGDSLNSLIELWIYKRLIEIIFDGVENKLSQGDRVKMQEKHVSVYQGEGTLSFMRDFLENLIIFKEGKKERFLALIDQLIKMIREGFSPLGSIENSLAIPLEAAKSIHEIEEELLRQLPFQSDLALVKFFWRQMSTGEKAYLNLFSRFHYAFEKMKAENRFEHSDLIYLLIDEPSTGFHPQWQKEYLNNLLFYLKKTGNSNFHLIIATHSPYLVSDLQKEDVVSLRTEKVQGKNYTDNTFGANIHELLADDFYLQNGFMGEFARQKINEAVLKIDKYGELSSEERRNLKSFVNIIGEPIVKERLEFLLNEKAGEQTKDEYISELEARIRDLEQRGKNAPD